jgi:hypothetical protein
LWAAKRVCTNGDGVEETRRQKPTLWSGVDRGVATDDEGDGKADAEHVGNDGDHGAREGKRHGLKTRKRHNDPVHHQVDGDAEGEAGEDGVARQELQFAADGVKDGSNGEGDEEMDGRTEKRRGPAAAERAEAEESGSNGLQEAVGTDAAREPAEKGSGYVQDAAKKASAENDRCGWKVLFESGRGFLKRG